MKGLITKLLFRAVLQVGGHCRVSGFAHSRFFHQYVGHLKTMKLNTPEFRQVFTPELQQLTAVFKKHDYELRIAGGAVRDLLMQKMPQDVDFATTATPAEMKEMFEKEGIRMINNKGEKHGTISARINDKENFEVTTLRIDVTTDGRHAEVEFTKDWQLDANRRDLTINAMFLGFDGTVYDYFDGITDLQSRRVRFVGNAEERIQEDYLRILRYFRFYGRIATERDSHEEGTLEAIRKNAAGLAGISGERIWMETRKILTGNFASSIIPRMIGLGMGPYIGLPDSPDVEEFQLVYKNTEGLSPHPLTLLSALLSDDKELTQLHQRMKLSNDELRLSQFLLQHRQDELPESAMKYCMDLVCDTAGKDSKVKDRILELLKYRGLRDVHDDFAEWSPPPFPITGHDLIILDKVPKGPRFSRTLSELRQEWKNSNYTLTKEELLKKIDNILERVSS